MAICKLPYKDIGIITFSDEGLMIRKNEEGNNFYYCYAVDVESANYEYVETDKLIEHTAMQVWQMETLGVDYWIPTMINVKVK